MIGITLGRLSRTFNKNHIQIVPKNIEKEFFLANKIGYDFIEEKNILEIEKPVAKKLRSHLKKWI
tara:strand:- start:748 stop:942 length:195 start_codon:yes stop_codon:yes gene_type:complete